MMLVSGYTGGWKESPTYEEVSSGRTGHYEAVLVRYDPSRVSYERLLRGLLEERGSDRSGRSVLRHGKPVQDDHILLNEHQRELAEESKRRIRLSGIFEGPIVTEIMPFKVFYPAEDHHQGYHLRNGPGFMLYHDASGRGPFPFSQHPPRSCSSPRCLSSQFSWIE